MMGNENHSDRAHAVFSPSGFARWGGVYPDYNGCTASINMEADIPDTDSPYAKEGTLAHEICEAKVRHYIDPDGYSKRKLSARLKKLKNEAEYAPEMDKHTDAYLEYIKAQALVYDKTPYIAVEQRYSIPLGDAESFGTSDCVIIGDDTLQIVDFKYGRGVKVDAEHNPQLMLYALGACKQYDMFYQFSKVKLCIFQPRLDHISEWEVSTVDLIGNFAQIARAKVTEALNNPQFKPSETSCRFCKAKAICRARAQKNLELAGFVTAKPDTIGLEEIEGLIKQGSDVAKWLEDLKAYALKLTLSGTEVPGLKAVEGRGSRVWTDMDEAFKRLNAKGYEDGVLYERKPLTLAQVEKIVGKKDFGELVGDLVEKKAGKPTLVPISDKREAINNIPSATEAFGTTKEDE